MTEVRMARGSFWALPTAGRGDLRQFGGVMGVVFGLIGAWVWYKGRVDAAQWLGGIAGFFLVAGLLLPVVLKPIYVVWMYLARLLGWVNTHLLLGLVFYTLFVLIGGIMRLLRHDPLNRKLEPGRESYWLPRSQSLLPKDHFEKQF